MAKVNLDAIIQREDFEATGENKTQNTFTELPIIQLTNVLFFPYLRKPDFQRETNEWDAKKICDFLESFINGDLIPSIILWRNSSGLYFVIDGAHRLSALLAWIKDDYGDGELSLKYFEGQINEEQKKIADDTRKLINRKIGSYQDILKSQETGNILLIEKAKNLGFYSLNVQWVKGDAKKAEHSFFKINQQGVALNNTEKKLLENRDKGNCIAARAIKTGGTGHKYWSDFSAEIQRDIQSVSEEINKCLFTPPLLGPVKSLDLPIAGKISSSQTVPLILDFVNIVNKIPVDFKDIVKPDKTGEETLRYLKNVRKIVWRINSAHPSSLGLHPLVYFYSLDGRHKPASFYAIAEFISELDRTSKFSNFITVRKNFETFLLKYNYLSQQITEKYKYANKSYKYISNLYIKLMELLEDGVDYNQTAINLCSLKEFNYLKLDQNTSDESIFANFTTEKKSAVFIKEALTNPIRCKICGGLIHQNSITIDHIIRKDDGGLGSVENGQIFHPFCNSTIKN
jgi:hypothetical protein